MTKPKLSLYYRPTCGYCLRVLHAIERLGVDVELRHTGKNAQLRDELVRATGRGTVPVLRIDDPDGNPSSQTRWLPESLDIIRYLQHYASEPETVPAWVDTLARRTA